MSSDPLSISDAARLLRDGSLTSVELTTRCLSVADELDGELGTYVSRFDRQALAAAAGADAELAAGEDRGALHGIPVGVKDIIAAREGPTTAQSSAMDPDWGAGRDAPVVSRLRQAGAVITGKLTTMEFALGMNEASAGFPMPRNPWDPDTWTGGSSSGAASGVATGMFLAAIGTDTAASIRLPAAFCGVSGLKPTFGRVPKSGVVPLSGSLDHVGPLARSVHDCAIVLDVIGGHHDTDPSSATVKSLEFTPDPAASLNGIRIGVDRDRRALRHPSAAAGRFEAALDALVDLGADIVDVTVPLYDEVTTAVMVTMFGEGLAHHRQRLGQRWERYLAGTRELLALGALATAADYVQAQRVRREAQRRLASVFAQVDLIAEPTAEIGAPTFERLEADGVLEVFQRVNTAYWNGVGNPALAVPMGGSSDELPLSLQLVAPAFHEQTLLRVGDAYQRVTDWHLRCPPCRSRPPSGGDVARAASGASAP